MDLAPIADNIEKTISSTLSMKSLVGFIAFAGLEQAISFMNKTSSNSDQEIFNYCLTGLVVATAYNYGKAEAKDVIRNSFRYRADQISISAPILLGFITSYNFL